MNADLCIRLLSRYARMSVLICTCLFEAVRTDAQILHLPDAVSKAIDNYPLIKQRQAVIAAQSAHITTVDGNRLPSLKIHDQVTFGTDNSLNGSYFPGIVSTSGGIRAQNNPDAASGNIALSQLEWEFYNFGYYHAAHQQAEAARFTARAVLQRDTYLFTGQVIMLYLDMVKHYRLQQVEKENRDRATGIANAIRALATSGLKPGVDSMTAHAEYAKANIAYQQAKEAYESDRAAMAAYTGLNTEMITPDTLLPGKIMEQQLPLTDTITTDHPLLAVYQKAIEQQQADNNATAHKYLPRLYLEGAAWMRGSSINSAGIYNDNLLGGLSYSRYNYLFGLAFTYNLFDIKHRHDQLAEGRLQADALEYDKAAQQINLERAIRQADISYRSVLEQAASVPQETEAARQAYTQQLALYNAGLGTLTDVTNALYTLQQTETDDVLIKDNMLRVLYMRAGLSNQVENFLQMFKQ